MCGIYGYIGKSGAVEVCLEGLRFLEYRGYDSSGIATIESGNLHCYKEKGKLSALEKTLQSSPVIDAPLAIGHTRWATHGRGSKRNAHPHLDEKKELALVHNGILENHHELREILSGKGVIFATETDSEVICQLIAHLYRGDLVKAVHEATGMMQGFWAIALIHKDQPDQIVTARKENPIVVAFSGKTHEGFVSSDAYAFMRKDLDLYFLSNHEIAKITRDGIEFFDQNLQLIDKTPELIDLPSFTIEKGAYDHFMLKEIYEQPKTIQAAIMGRYHPADGTTSFETLGLSSSDFVDTQKVVFIGCGSSWHAGSIAALQFEALAGLPSTAEIASELRYKETPIQKGTLFIALSQSGETLDTIAAVRSIKERGGKVLIICNMPCSTLVREADHTLLLQAGPEISVCSTKTFTSQLSLLFILSMAFASVRGMAAEKQKELFHQLEKLPEIVEEVLSEAPSIALLAKKYTIQAHFFFLGRQYMYPTSLESSLKLKEISYLSAYGYPGGELKHGPMALIDSDHLVIGLCGHTPTYEKILSNLAEVKARGAKILALAPKGAAHLEEIADDIIFLPPICDPLAPIPYSVASQLFAYYTALECGEEIDQPRNLAKSVTVE
ncbi:MAG: Glutamine--fructose-6-phosphate aminotransferase [isomerizing] [Chlamydiae bacterium]|nr:Glutamine--fructose-6-phosphate aminotransferase [isomerizing] [Chlamydiota bacterium]